MQDALVSAVTVEGSVSDGFVDNFEHRHELGGGAGDSTNTWFPR